MVAAAIALTGFKASGPIWPDSPRYANAAAMIHDWMLADGWPAPIPFAEANYAHLPGFSVPYHPPGYPAALGVWFLVTGDSYASARVFIAGCWALAGWLFYRINRELMVGRGPAFAAGLLMLTTPQMAFWSRDAMSEVPSLVPLFAAALFWLRWLRTGRARDGLFALALAEAAFFFRVTTAGVLPGLVLFGAMNSQWDRRRVSWIAAAGAAYLLVNAAWVAFAAQYSIHEIAADGKGKLWGAQVWEYFSANLPGIAASGTAALAALGLARGAADSACRRAIGFWLAWLASFTAFKAIVPTTLEARHFFTAFPAFAGLAAAAFSWESARQRVAAGLLYTAAIAVNLILLADCPKGITGYQAAGDALARCREPGNVLLACWEDQDLIFRYRSANPPCERYLLRSDRTLAIRLSHYAKAEAVVTARTDADVLELLRAGRIKYVVCCSPRLESSDTRPEEMHLVEGTIRAHPELFRQLGDFEVNVDYVDGIHSGSRGDVCLWEFTEYVESGPPNLTIPIPTAGLELRP
jgi:4-amino-4-deoxy-L-arabinose transferase-like glycosyltransferase